MSQFQAPILEPDEQERQDFLNTVYQSQAAEEDPTFPAFVATPRPTVTREEVEEYRRRHAFTAGMPTSRVADLVELDKMSQGGALVAADPTFGTLFKERMQARLERFQRAPVLEAGRVGDFLVVIGNQ